MEGMTAATEAYIHDETITITLDDCPKTFMVSKALLCSTSTYFTKALDGGFAEAKTRTLKLPGCDPATFELFIYFFTTKRFPDFVGPNQGKDLDNASVAAIQARLVRAWVFGDYMRMPLFQNQAMNCLLDFLGVSRIHVATVEMVFENAPTDSVLRQVAVSECVWRRAFHTGFSSSSMRRLAKLLDFLYEFADAMEDQYKLELDWDQYPHSQEDRSEYMVAQEGSAGKS